MVAIWHLLHGAGSCFSIENEGVLVNEMMCPNCKVEMKWAVGDEYDDEWQYCLCLERGNDCRQIEYSDDDKTWWVGGKPMSQKQVERYFRLKAFW